MSCDRCRPTANGILAPAFDAARCDCLQKSDRPIFAAIIALALIAGVTFLGCLGVFRDSDGTATAAACEDMPVPKDCQARAGTASPKGHP